MHPLLKFCVMPFKKRNMITWYTYFITIKGLAYTCNANTAPRRQMPVYVLWAHAHIRHSTNAVLCWRKRLPDTPALPHSTVQVYYTCVRIYTHIEYIYLYIYYIYICIIVYFFIVFYITYTRPSWNAGCCPINPPPPFPATHPHSLALPPNQTSLS